MSSIHGLVWPLSVCLSIASLGCTREVVPESVRRRVAYTELDPSGTWSLEGSNETLTLTRPEGNGQLFHVEHRGAAGTLRGEALVEGDRVFATRHSGGHANDLCLYLYRRREDGVLEALWGSHRGNTPIAYEEAHPAGPTSGWDGVYAEWGNNRGGRYHDRLIIGRSLDGVPELHRLHWTQPSQGWYRGMAMEIDDRLVGVRLPGVLVSQRSWTAGNTTVTERRTEVGRNLLWHVGGYRREGDALVGIEASSAHPGIRQARWVRGGSGGEAPEASPSPPIESVAEEPVAEEPVAEEPVAEEPVAEEPVADEPGEPVDDEAFAPE